MYRPTGRPLRSRPRRRSRVSSSSSTGATTSRRDDGTAVRVRPPASLRPVPGAVASPPRRGAGWRRGLGRRRRRPDGAGAGRVSPICGRRTSTRSATSGDSPFPRWRVGQFGLASSSPASAGRVIGAVRRRLVRFADPRPPRSRGGGVCAAAIVPSDQPRAGRAPLAARAPGRRRQRHPPARRTSISSLLMRHARRERAAGDVASDGRGSRRAPSRSIH